MCACGLVEFPNPWGTNKGPNVISKNFLLKKIFYNYTKKFDKPMGKGTSAQGAKDSIPRKYYFSRYKNFFKMEYLNRVQHISVFVTTTS